MDKMFSKAEVFTKQANDIGLSDQKRASANVKLNNTLLGIEALKPKLHVEHQSDLRGVEEQVDSFGEYEGTD
jgi:hypothetical protein